MKLFIVTALVAAIAAVTAFAGETKVEYKEISFADLKSLVASKKVALIDVNGSESFAKGHIPGAVDFAVVEKDLASVLPKDKNALVVAYCGGPACNAWSKGAAAATKLGYTNVQHFKDGIKGWKDQGGTMEVAPAADAKAPTFADIDFATLSKLVNEKKVVLVDVNGTESFNAGHIPGALDFTAEKDLAAKLPKDKNALIVAYCGSPACNAWKRGAEQLAKLGYTNVQHFKDGIKGWKDQGGRMETVGKT